MNKLLSNKKEKERIRSSLRTDSLTISFIRTKTMFNSQEKELIHYQRMLLKIQASTKSNLEILVWALNPQQ